MEKDGNAKSASRFDKEFIPISWIIFFEAGYFTLLKFSGGA